MSRRASAPLRHSVVAYLALFFALTMGTAYATHPGGENTISTADIQNGAVTNVKIAPASVQTGRIADGAVTNAKIALESITNNRIAPGAVNTGRLANGAVITRKLADGAVTAAKLADGPYWALGGNAGTSPGSDFLGTTDDTPLHFRVNGQRALRLEPALNGGAPAPNVIGGGPDNQVTAGVHSATIAGGGRGLPDDPATANQVTDHGGTVGGGALNQAGNAAGTTSDRRYATVAGGVGHTASGVVATVGGGLSNTASGGEATVSGGTNNSASELWATVGGGVGHTAGGAGATVGGGDSNSASGSQATVPGGSSNSAGGSWATVAGGLSNTAAGDWSLVAGRRAKNTDAAHGGVFLFADSTNADFASAAANEFAVRASGGVRLRTSSDLTTGCNLAAGSGTWACTSDRAAKRGFEAVDGETVLSRLAELPITTWSFKSDGSGARHIGPTAQDFYAAFGLGADDKTISSVDADGVALAAVQGLNERLERENARLRQALGEHEARLARLERALNR
jgi:hypothetical protein